MYNVSARQIYDRAILRFSKCEDVSVGIQRLFGVAVQSVTLLVRFKVIDLSDSNFWIIVRLGKPA